MSANEEDDRPVAVRGEPATARGERARGTGARRASARRWRWVLFLPTLLGFAVFLAFLVEKLRAGRVAELLDALRTGRYWQIGVLLALLLLPLVFVIGAAVTWWQRREERDFERRFGRREGSSDGRREGNTGGGREGPKP